MQTRNQPHISLTIAGSDSGGGAGIQADIKAMSATGSFACSVITALTAQNTQGVSAIHPVPQSFVEDQLESIFSDMKVDAVKIGMLSDADTILMIAQILKKYQPKAVILDPVMVATSGDVLLESQAISSLVNHLIPLADLITPNLYEAQVLLGRAVNAFPKSNAELESTANALLSLGSQGVLLKGGHMDTQDSTDVWVTENQIEYFSKTRVATTNTHGTGCTLSSAITSYLAQGFSMSESIRRAKEYISQALVAAKNYQLGQGSGPVDHFFMLKA
ncbi:hydroxymethylpyrimidine kinase [Marinomonas sp. SBI22]|uniref:bifunctional hydroxymethylpyrimidine kinase/phosphomethylpyrimidine kinase n=1 Tax=unclassified Marinomonas TaxID=196814 RepID=UPI0007AF1B04|nr:MULTISPECIES: bifunctional hydroxymethylpyrimidine kinase/phosphomethylpyrimidine kinase [unclassified Marinomonas]KZM44989.1 hydroxymethylpyrimidine kinase [Marinomonas sp. SBI22]KZM46688.1 hydroxymethylpyrimidine kinase [Marinomonas sp. SBI8L]